MAGTFISLEHFSDEFGTDIQLSSIALGARVVSVSDEFFAEALHLLLVEPAPSLKGQFGPKGALFSGWESRRHNPDHDWCIIKLGTTGTLRGFDIDTSNFNGNEAPEVSVDALFNHDNDEEPTKHDDSRWYEILQKVPLGPNSRHLFSIPETSAANYVKLRMYPDGGIARFRVYGHVSPVLPLNPTEPFDLAHVFSGGQVVFTSDQHFGAGSNLVLPGRGKDMSDGWETARSRKQGHRDWVIIKLGNGGFLSHVEIDTAHYMGNFPESCELHAIESPDIVPSAPENQWLQVLPRTKLGPHRRHFFQLESVRNIKYTHIRLTIHPDGGIKRVRVIGTQLPTFTDQTALIAPEADQAELGPGSLPAILAKPTGISAITIPAIPLTPEAFTPFGKVIQAYSNINAVPRNTKITGANQGSATKFHKLSILDSSYPSDTLATAGLSVYRCQPIDAQSGSEWTIKLLERHSHTNQAFIPMAGGNFLDDAGEALNDYARSYLVIVSNNGENDMPDLGSMRAFIASTGQGIVYNKGIWHHPMAVLEKPLDLACVETQIGDGSKLDCEVIELDATKVVYKVKIPEF